MCVCGVSVYMFICVCEVRVYVCLRVHRGKGRTCAPERRAFSHPSDILLPTDPILEQPAAFSASRSVGSPLLGGPVSFLWAPNLTHSTSLALVFLSFSFFVLLCFFFLFLTCSFLFEMKRRWTYSLKTLVLTLSLTGCVICGKLFNLSNLAMRFR